LFGFKYNKNTSISKIKTFLSSILSSQYNANNDLLLLDNDISNDTDDLIYINNLVKMYKKLIKEKSPDKNMLQNVTELLSEAGLL
jgi:hypothetical protein